MTRMGRVVAIGALLLASCDIADDLGGGVQQSGSAVVQDYWAPLVKLKTPNQTNPLGTPWEVTPIHASLRPDGKIVIIGHAGVDPSLSAGAPFTGVLDPGGAWDPIPATMTVQPDAIPYEVPYCDPANPSCWSNGEYFSDDLFCAGHTLLADGRQFVVGGLRIIANLHDPATAMDDEMVMAGLPSAFLQSSTSWTRTPFMTGNGVSGWPLRWYPTATRLANGEVLVTGGEDLVLHTVGGNYYDVDGDDVADGPHYANPTVEMYSPVTGAFRVVSTAAQTPRQLASLPGHPYLTSLWNPDYTHAFQMPADIGAAGYDVMMFGATSRPILFDWRTSLWNERQNARPAVGGPTSALPNYGASSVLLPLRLTNDPNYANGSVLQAGGDHGTAHEWSMDVYDPVANLWKLNRSMASRRHHPSTVLLPDGRILIVNGHDDLDVMNVVNRHTLYVDPKNSFSVDYGADEVPCPTEPQCEVRGYHSVALLLPDGRVFVGGGRKVGPETDPTNNERDDFRFYYPLYMFDPNRSIIVGGVPATAAYGASFDVTLWKGGTETRTIQEGALVGLGSMTHSIDMNQRHIQVAVTTLASGQIRVTMPAGAKTAPPGPYMLFVLDNARTPTQGAIFTLQ